MSSDESKDEERLEISEPQEEEYLRKPDRIFSYTDPEVCESSPYNVACILLSLAQLFSPPLSLTRKS